jgi:hypothetical protein
VRIANEDVALGQWLVFTGDRFLGLFDVAI